jgi:hypothetical protein
MARPSHQPSDKTRAQVEALVACGIPQEEIARLLRISPNTLVKHYEPELQDGLVKANARVANNLFRMATGQGREALGAACFWLKTRAGWRETMNHSHEGKLAVSHGSEEAILSKLARLAEEAGSAEADPKPNAGGAEKP